jgi:adenosylcobalamin-dependent ribonucleoside-triphosphate reductase
MLNFKLSDQFVDSYRDRTVPWGYRDAGHTALGEIVFLRSYSRLKDDDTKETWADVCRRVTEGTYSIQKDWCRTHKLTWKNDKAQQSAKEFFDRLFNMKWTPAGRGLWAMGSTLVNDHKSMATLVNCAFVTTNKNITQAATWLMDASMLGIGVGFDVRGAGQRTLVQPPTTTATFIVEDSREGWVSVLDMLLKAYLSDGTLYTNIDYSLIRPEGAPIVTAGGVAPGPLPLIKMVDRLHTLFQDALDAGTPVVDSRMIVDIMNIVGDCVVSGGVRRTAEIAFGSMDDQDFMKLKDPEAFPYRSEWAHLSNNSIFAKPGEDLTPILEGIKLNGEPGVVWLDTVQNYGRLSDLPDDKDKDVLGLNPCGEIPLEPFELCNLSETYPSNHESLEDFLRTLKFAYLYSKTVSLLTTPWENTNAITQKNRRIGVSMSGVTDFVDARGYIEMKNWQDAGYKQLKRMDHTYSEWLCVRESIRLSTAKPSGTVSLLAGVSPGVHWTPGGEYFLRRIIFVNNDPTLEALRQAGYKVEPSDYSPDTSSVVAFPVESKSKRSERDVSIFEKAHVAAMTQKWWADNAVSCTVSFTSSEAEKIGDLLQMYDGDLKGISFLPMMETGGTYTQMPYERITKAQFEELGMNLLSADFSSIYSGNALDGAGEKYCSNDGCEVPAK